MAAPFLIPWISGQVVNAFCWTLIHSIWIGLLMSGLTGSILISTQKSTAQLRYQLLCGTLLAFALIMGFVVYLELATAQPKLSIAAKAASADFRPLASLRIPAVAAIDSAHIQEVVRFINDKSGWLFTVWVLIFSIKSLKLISGLYYVHRIRTHKVYAIGGDWKNKIIAFGQALKIQHSVTLLQSELVKVPVTVGLLKPVILVPIGLIFRLPPEQIEAILWHELAHIQRRDYLINILQSLLDVVFFFNPGLLWLSSLIRDEREACCDDIVLAHTIGRRHYVDALLACQPETNQPGFLMALGLGSHHLVYRLNRIVTQENKRLTVVEKLVLLAGFMLASVFAFSSQPEPRSPQRLTHPNVNGISRRSVPVPKKAATILTAFTIPYRTTSRPNVKQETIDASLTQPKANRQQEVQRLQESQHATLALRQDYSKTESLSRKWLDKPVSGKTARSDSNQARSALSNFKKKQLTDPSKDLAAKTQFWNQQRALQEPSIASDRQRIRGVLTALVHHNVIADASAVDWFGLSEEELIVNGIRQSDELHQQLKAQYAIRTQYGLYYGPVKMVGTGVFMDKTDL